MTSLFGYQIMVVQLKIESGKLTFDPPFRELRDILLRLLTDIVQNAEDLPRVSLSFHGTYTPSNTTLVVGISCMPSEHLYHGYTELPFTPDH